MAKGLEVAAAVNKAAAQAKKNLIKVPIVNQTIPHAVLTKYGSAKVLIKPAPKGTGLKAGGAVRVILELAGVPNASAKMLGSSSKINNAAAALQALDSLKTLAAARPKKEKEEEAKEPVEA